MTHDELIISVENIKQVEPLDVAKAYLQAEIAKHPERAEKTLEDCQSDEDVVKLLYHYSREVRSNGVHEAIVNGGYSWELKDVPIEEMSMSFINRPVNIVLGKVNNNLAAFVDYLREYFAKYPDSDPEELDEFRPDPERHLEYDTVIAIDRGDTSMIDGNHRAVQLAMRGDKTIKTYFGSKRF